MQVEISVVDGSGGVLPNATVTLKSKSATFTAAFDLTSGMYRAAVAPDDYQLDVSAESFTTFEKRVRIDGPRTARFTASLEVHIDERVHVRGAGGGASPLTNGVTLSGEQLRELPTQPFELLRTLQNMAGTRGTPGDVAIYVNGFRNVQQLPPTDAIELIRINANPFATEFAEPGSRRVEIVTKAGAQSTYGQVSFSWNGPGMNARPALSLAPNTAETKNGSGMFSLPLRRDKWGLTIYAGRWSIDDQSVIRATTLDQALTATPFNQTVPSSNDIQNVTAQTSYQRGGTLFAMEYVHNGNSAANQGLTTGVDLPERAFSTTQTQHAFRVSALSVLSPRAVHDLRVEAVMNDTTTQAATSAPAVVVFDAFSAGGNQDALFLDDSDRRVEVRDSVIYATKNHSLKAGAGMRAIHLAETNRTNFGGTFTFGTAVERDASGQAVLDAAGAPVPVTPIESYRRTVLGLPGYGPTFFSIARGSPESAVSQVEFNWFVQDEWRVSDRLAVSYGLRHDVQTNAGGAMNLAPRGQVSWATPHSGVLRAGAGVFYATVPPNITLDTVRLDGQRQQWLTVESPTFFPQIPATLSSATETSTITRVKAPDLGMPFQFVSTLAYERDLSAIVHSSVTYTWTRGVDLLRTRDVNAPVPGTAGIRPNPAEGPVLQFESTGRSARHELTFAVSADAHRMLTLNANYTLASTRTDTETPYTAAANPYDMTGEFGPALNDYRHTGYLGATAHLPYGLSFSPSISAHSGGTFNILSGTDGGSNGLFVDRPAFASPGSPDAISTPFGVFTVHPAAGQPLIPRNYGRAPGELLATASLFKTFTLSKNERRYVMVGVNGENVINHPNLDMVMGIVTAPNFGQPNHAGPARRITVVTQFGF